MLMANLRLILHLQTLSHSCLLQIFGSVLTGLVWSSLVGRNRLCMCGLGLLDAAIIYYVDERWKGKGRSRWSESQSHVNFFLGGSRYDLVQPRINLKVRWEFLTHALPTRLVRFWPVTLAIIGSCFSRANLTGVPCVKKVSLIIWNLSTLDYFLDKLPYKKVPCLG